MNTFDRFKSYVSRKLAPPGYGLYERKKVSQAIRSAFAGAEIGRTVSGWSASGASADGSLQMSFEVLRNRGRDLAKNNPNVRSWMGENISWVLGPEGIQLQSIVGEGSKNEESFDELNDALEFSFEEWFGRADSVDVAGRENGRDMQRKILAALDSTGETPLIRFVYKKCGRSRIPLSIQILEIDRLDFNYNVPASGSRNEIRNSIEIDEYGRAVAFWILKNHPGGLRGTTKERIRVPKEDLIFEFIAERPEQSRGFTRLNAVMLPLRHVADYLNAALVRKKIEAAVTFFIKRIMPEESGGFDPKSNVGEMKDVTPPDGVDEATDNRPSEIEMSAGAIIQLDDHEEMQSSPLASNPSADGPFVDTTMTQVAAGLLSSVPAVTKDFSKYNYSSLNASRISEKEAYKIVQKWFGDHIMQPIYEKFVFYAWLSDLVDMPDYRKNPGKYDRPRWMARGFPHSDPLKEVLAEKEELSGRLITYSEALARRGKDFKKTVKALRREQEILKKYDIQPDFMIDQIAKDSSLKEQLKMHVKMEALKNDEN